MSLISVKHIKCLWSKFWHIANFDCFYLEIRMAICQNEKYTWDDVCYFCIQTHIDEGL